MVNGFAEGERAEAVVTLQSWLTAAGHGVDRLDLAEAGFDRFMSAEEREAYHGDQPLITPETKAAARALLGATAVVICYPVFHGTAPARVKSWQERVFVLGLAFRFKPSGKITGALDHLARTLVVGVANRPDPEAAKRNGFGPCLARSFFLSSNRVCRARYVGVTPDDLSGAISALGRW